ncbi:MAG: hypothetical protein K6G30_07390, partial [Acetatifactor sp.]|nr:hypothetical protein [Acetatifactor sp.]
MIELFEEEIRFKTHKSSKGNQLKGKSKGLWYKADYTGYEGLSEYVISHLLEMSSLSPEEYVLYEAEQIKYKMQLFNGVKSKDFLTEDWQIITIERLFENAFKHSLNSSIYKIEEPEERLKFVVNQVERITGLREFGAYMNK